MNAISEPFAKHVRTLGFFCSAVYVGLCTNRPANGILSLKEQTTLREGGLLLTRDMPVLIVLLRMLRRVGVPAQSRPAPAPASLQPSTWFRLV